MSDRAPGLRLHSRTMQVQAASGELAMFVAEWVGKHELTPGEVAAELASQLQAWIKYVIRYERHGDYEHKADEA